MKEKQATEVKEPNIFIGMKSHMSVGGENRYKHSGDSDECSKNRFSSLKMTLTKCISSAFVQNVALLI